MTEKRLNPGEILFEEGASAPMAFQILQGRVEVLRQGEKIAEYGPREVVGETALFDDMNAYLYSVRALTETTVDSLTGSEVQALLGQCPPRLAPVVISIFKRLRSSANNPAGSAQPVKPAMPKEEITPVLGADVEKITITAASEETAASVKSYEIPVSHLPFRIGGYDRNMELSQIRKGNHLNIPSEGPPLIVSVNHCEIIQQDGTLYVLDLGSRHGTAVNGHSIGRGKGFYKAPLKKGENTLVLGEKKTSPYTLTVTCHIA